MVNLPGDTAAAILDPIQIFVCCSNKGLGAIVFANTNGITPSEISSKLLTVAQSL